jgi:hypothetical protein
MQRDKHADIREFKQTAEFSKNRKNVLVDGEPIRALDLWVYKTNCPL